MATLSFQLQPDDNERHRFGRDTLRAADITFLDMGSFATWVPKLKEQMQGDSSKS